MNIRVLWIPVFNYPCFMDIHECLWISMQELALHFRSRVLPCPMTHLLSLRPTVTTNKPDAAYLWAAITVAHKEEAASSFGTKEWTRFSRKIRFEVRLLHIWMSLCWLVSSGNPASYRDALWVNPIKSACHAPTSKSSNNRELPITTIPILIPTFLYFQRRHQNHVMPKKSQKMKS